MLPSVKTLLRLTHNANEKDVAKKIRYILEAKTRWPERALYEISDVIGCYGVESIDYWPGCMKQGFDYINTGDTYNTTLAFDYRLGTFRVTTFGDEVELHEKRCARCRKANDG